MPILITEQIPGIIIVQVVRFRQSCHFLGPGPPQIFNFETGRHGEMEKYLVGAKEPNDTWKMLTIYIIL